MNNTEKENTKHSKKHKTYQRHIIHTQRRKKNENAGNKKRRKHKTKTMKQKSELKEYGP